MLFKVMKIKSTIPTWCKIKIKHITQNKIVYFLVQQILHLELA